MGILDKVKNQQTDASATKSKAKKAAPKKSAAKKDSVVKKVTKHAQRILVEPVFTEKSLKLQAENKIVFFVPKKANKVQIRYAINELYNVTPSQINIINSKGKVVKRWVGKNGKQVDKKKAIITLPKGTDLTIFSS